MPSLRELATKILGSRQLMAELVVCKGDEIASVLASGLSHAVDFDLLAHTGCGE